METTALPAIIAKLLTTKSCTREEFRRIYRYLCKHTHPDLTGKNSADFIRLTEMYNRIAEKKEIRSGRSPDFDPFHIITESGYDADGDPRAALFISLYRYMATGLHSYRIRNRAPLKERNAMILRTVLYWAGMYSRSFVQIFVDYNTRVVQQIRSTSVLKQEGKGKRFFLEGFDWFFRYQQAGTTAAKRLAEDRLQFCLYTFTLSGSAESPVVPFARWLLDELDKDPAYIQRLH